MPQLAIRSTRRRWALTGAALWLLVVLPLAVLVASHWSPLLRLDQDVVDGLHPAAAGSPGYVRVLDVITTAGTSWFRLLVLLPVLVWAVRTRRLRLGVLLVVAGTLIGPLTTVLKDLVARPRPEFTDAVFGSDSFSHPSGHSSGIATLVGLLLVAGLRLQPPGRRAWIVAAAVLAVLLVGGTRIALGAHYPSDVLSGWALGAGWVLLLTAAFNAGPGPVDETPDPRAPLSRP